MCGFDVFNEDIIERYELPDGFILQVGKWSCLERGENPVNSGHEDWGLVTIVCWKGIGDGDGEVMGSGRDAYVDNLLGHFQIDPAEVPTMNSVTDRFGPCVALMPLYGLPLEPGDWKDAYLTLRPDAGRQTFAHIGWVFITREQAMRMHQLGLTPRSYYEEIDDLVTEYDNWLHSTSFAYQIRHPVTDQVLVEWGHHNSRKIARSVGADWQEMIDWESLEDEGGSLAGDPAVCGLESYREYAARAAAH